MCQDPRLAPSHATHADGRELEPEELELIRRVQWEESRALSWEAGDLLVLDNRLVGHGRMGFKLGSNRRVVVAITQ